MMELLSHQENISTVDIAHRFGVSAMTIRRDIKSLEDSGAVVRCYGGAIPARRISFEFAFDARHRRNLPAKRRIGAAAAGRVRPSESIFLDTGTTTLEIAKALAAADTPCQVATSSLVVASALWGRGRIELLLLGGRIRAGNPDLVGPATEVMLERLTPDVAFLGSDGIDPARGCFCSDIEVARIAERMVTNAGRVVVVTDSSKLGTAGAVRYLRTEDMDELITDRGAAKPVIAALRRRGVTVTLV